MPIRTSCTLFDAPRAPPAYTNRLKCSRPTRGPWARVDSGGNLREFFLSCFAHTVYHSHPDSLARLHSPVWLAYSLWLAYTGTLARLCLWLAYLHSRLYTLAADYLSLESRIAYTTPGFA